MIAIKRPRTVQQSRRLESEQSDAWLAEDIGCSDHTVRAERERLESISQIATCDDLIRRDGTTYPREKKQAAFVGFVIDETGTCRTPPRRRCPLCPANRGEFSAKKRPSSNTEKSGV